LLRNLKRLKSLISVANLEIEDNGLLRDLKGLENLETVESLVIAFNDSLNNLKGLESLKYIEEHLLILENGSLGNLKSLEGLEYVGWLEIIANYELCTSLADALRDQILAAGGIRYINITGNKDCSNRARPKGPTVPKYRSRRDCCH
jgi:hypothetical protein